MTTRHPPLSSAAVERDAALAEVEAAKRAAIVRGLKVLREWAARGRPFSANQVRDELRAVGVGSSAAGALFNAAIKARVINAVGYEKSTDPGTHHKPVLMYVAGSGVPRRPAVPPVSELITVPARRDTDGRFTNAARRSSPVDAALFDIPVGD